MVRRRGTTDGRLEDALASLMQAHASLAQNQAAFLSRISEIDAPMAETNRVNSEHFARTEAILMDLMRMMQRLPEEVRDKIGFKPPASSVAQ
jgi:hypothetical protein